MNIRAEQLGYWYLRLNGFLTTANFIVHPDVGRNQETDVDILGVRFPYRSENLIQPMEDDALSFPIGKTLVVFAEIKTGMCNLNGPWTKPERDNMRRVLMAVGPLHQDEAATASDSLYAQGVFENQLYRITLLCLGQTVNPEIENKYPQILQVTWDRVFSFIFRRFHDYSNQKSSHGQWEANGLALWDAAMSSSAEEEFQNSIKLVG